MAKIKKKVYTFDEPKELLENIQNDSRYTVEKDFINEAFSPRPKIMVFSIIEKETPDKVIYSEHHFRMDINRENISYYEDKSTRQKFLCVGGSLNGQKKMAKEAVEYVSYNCSEFNRGERNPTIPKQILVFKDNLIQK